MNSCRIYAYLLENHIFSKLEAGIWAIEHLPKEYTELIDYALQIYKGNNSVAIDTELLLNFKEYIKKEVNSLIRK